MKTIRFENLVGKDGKTVEVEVPDDFMESFSKVSERAVSFAQRIQAVNELRRVESLEEIAELGRISGQKLFEVFGNGQTRNNKSTRIADIIL